MIEGNIVFKVNIISADMLMVSMQLWFRENGSQSIL